MITNNILSINIIFSTYFLYKNMYYYAQQFHIHPMINLETGRSIKIGGSMYNRLVRK